MKILIKGGRVIDPANKIDAIRDILIDGARISKVEKNIKAGTEEVIDAAGKIVIPGIVDMHVHLREPGREDKETVSSGTAAAVKGGVTSVLAMPNTEPAMDCPENIKLLSDIIKKDAAANVFICGAITMAREGNELTDFAKLKKAGAIAVSDDGSSVDCDKLMSEAFKRAKKEGLLVICHSEDKTLSGSGAVNRGIVATRMGLRGISAESEYKRVERDIKLAKASIAPVHIAHISCKESVELIAKAKTRGVKVTCETAPHYFSLDETAVLGYDSNLKMNPPLRSKVDVSAVKKGFKDGTIDVIASDHAPHTENEKEIEFERAAFGVIGLETELAAAISELVSTGVLTWPKLVEKLSLNPARILGIKKGTLGVGADADIVIVDPDREWVLQKEDIVSKSKNSPFLGKKFKGQVVYTICAGKVIFKPANRLTG